jgi:hypothetical protein
LDLISAIMLSYLMLLGVYLRREVSVLA